MKITKILKQYRYKKALLETTLQRIKVYQEAMKSNNLHLLGYYTKKSTEIGMPKAQNSTSPVENEIFNRIQENDLTKELVQEWIDEEYSRLWMTRVELEQIEMALKALTMDEHSIITWKYMDNMTWYNIEISYFETYKKTVNFEALQKKNTDALGKLNRILVQFYERFGGIS